MTRSEITVNELNGAFANHETADTIDKDNDHSIAAASNFERMVISFELSAATADDTIKIIAGTGHPAFRAGIGDLTFEAAGGAERRPAQGGRLPLHHHAPDHRHDWL